jgi:hypothetical protein
MGSAFQYIVRFVDPDGNICYGNLSEEVSSAALAGTTVSLLTGDPVKGLKTVGEKRTISKVGRPSVHVPLRC